MRVFIIVVVSLIEIMNESRGQFRTENDIEWILPSSEARDYRVDQYAMYLQSILEEESHKNGNLRLSFARSISYPEFTLSNGKVIRYQEATIPHGFYDNVLFHERNNEIFGVFQTHAPVVELGYDFSARCGGGSNCNGHFTMKLQHSPVQLTIDIGEVNGGRCSLKTVDHGIFYFYDRNLSFESVTNPPELRQTGQDIVSTISKSWLSDLYRIMFETKLEMLAKRVKENISRNHRTFPLLAKVCHSIS